MEASKSRILKPFDTVINFNEDFPSESDTSGKTSLSAMSAIDGDPSLKLIDASQTEGIERKKRAVLTMHKNGSPAPYKTHHHSRSKTRGTHRLSNRISLSTEQVLSQAQFHCQLPVSGSSQPALFQLRSHSPPEREHPKPMKMPLESPGHGCNRTILITRSTSSHDSSTTVMSVCPEISSMTGGAHHSADKSLLNSAQTTKDNTYSQLQFVAPRWRESIKQGPNGISSFSGRAHSCEVILRSDAEQMSHLHSKELNNCGKRSENVVSSNLEELAPSMSIRAYEAELRSLRKQLAKRSQEAEQIARELVKVKLEDRHIQSRLKNTAYTDSLNEDTVSNLKSKITELYADLESLRCAHTQALDRQVDLQEENTALRRSCDWYAEQLHLTKSVRDKLGTENEKLQTLLRESGEINHRLTHENTCLQTQLVCSRAEFFTAKRNLSAQLDAIRIDMIEREALFERFSAERSSLEQLCAERAGQVSSLQAQVGNLQAELKASEELVGRQRDRLAYLESCIYSADSKRSELQEKLFQIEQKRTIEDMKSNEDQLSYSTALIRLEELERICEEKDRALELASEEKASLGLELTAACKEKDTLNNYLNQLKDSLARIEDGFDKARYELDSKHSQLVELIDQRDSLRKQLGLLELQLEESSKSLSDLKRENADLTDVVDNLRAKVPSRNDAVVQTDVPQWRVTPVDIPNQRSTGKGNVNITVNEMHTPTAWETITPVPTVGLPENLTTLRPSNGNIYEPQMPPSKIFSDDAEKQVDHAPSRWTPVCSTCNESGERPVFVNAPHSNDASSPVRLPSEQSCYTPSSIKSTPQGENGQWYYDSRESNGANFVQSSTEYAAVTCATQSAVLPGVDSVTGLGDLTSIASPLESTESRDDVVEQKVTVARSEGVKLCVPRQTTISQHDRGNRVHSVLTNKYNWDTRRNSQHTESEQKPDPSSITQPLNDVEAQISQGFLDKQTTSCYPQVSKASPIEDEELHVRLCDPRPERVNLSLLNVLEAQPYLCQPDSLNPEPDHLIGHTCRQTTNDAFHSLPDGTNPTLSTTESQGDAPSASYVCENAERVAVGSPTPMPRSAGSVFNDVGTANLVDHHSSAAPHLPLNDVLLCTGKAPIPQVSAHSQTDLSTERETLLQALHAATEEAALAVANLAAARHEADVQSAMAQRESLARQEAVEAQLHIMAELDNTKLRLDELQSELDKLRSEAHGLREEASTWRAQQDAYRSAHANELQALRSVIKTTTDHLTALSVLLREANQQKACLQTELARLRAGLRAELERYRLCNGAQVGEANHTVAVQLASVGVDVRNLERLLQDGASPSIINSRPLNRLTECFENLQTEITNLEDEIAHHAIAVHDAINGSLGPKGAWSADGTVECCVPEP